jgi:hypothetical protein
MWYFSIFNKNITVLSSSFASQSHANGGSLSSVPSLSQIPQWAGSAEFISPQFSIMKF